MNCLEFRRIKRAEPARMNNEMVAHARNCAGCAAFVVRWQGFEAELSAAARIPVDDGLARRIVLNHRLGERPSRIWAIAASMLLAVFISVGAVWQITAPSPVLATASVEHVLHEPVAMLATRHVEAAELANALSLSGATLSSTLQVSYLRDCPVPGGWGKHFVVNTPMGKATIITMPNQKVYRRLMMNERGLSVAVAPAQMGSFVVIADSPQALASAEKIVAGAVNWRL